MSDLRRKSNSWKARQSTKRIRLASDRLENEDWFTMSESVYAELRSVGFDGTYETGLRFLEWYCNRLRERSAALS